MKVLRLIPAALLLGGAMQAQAQLSETDKVRNSLLVENKDTVAWIRSGLVQVGANQGFLHNWAAGGEVISLAVDGLLSANITRLYHRQVWSNTLDASYSLFYAYSNKFVPRKVDDRLDFTSKYGTRLDSSSNFYLTGLFNLKSQFTRGFDYNRENWQQNPTSSFMAPGYFTLAAGAEYRRGNTLTLFLSPAAVRMTVVQRKYTILRDEGAFGVPKGETFRAELGAYFSGRYQVDITPGIRYKTRLDLYSNYLAKNRTDTGGRTYKDNPGNIDIFWDNLLSFKLGKYINLNIAVTAIYDNDVPYLRDYQDANGVPQTKDEPGNGLGWVQLKEVMSFGIAYRFR